MELGKTDQKISERKNLISGGSGRQGLCVKADSLKLGE